MKFSTSIVSGPPVASVSREEAEKQLRNHKLFPKDSHVTLNEVNGLWVAAIVTEAAGPPFAEMGGGPDAASEASPTPDAGNDSPAPEGPEESKEEPKEKSDKPKSEDHKGLEGQIHHLTEMLTMLVTALGLGGDANPVPGMDAGPPPPPAPAGPPTGGDNKQHLVHERSLKPGEAPPGSTPIGAPAFASVRDDHPWKHLAGEAPTWTVEEELAPSDKPSEVFEELKDLADEIGYNVRQYQTKVDGDKRIARAIISSH
jgi:hypothetical protein